MTSGVGIQIEELGKKVNIWKITRGSIFSSLEEGYANRKRRKARICPLALEWKWSYHYELMVVDMHRYRNKYMCNMCKHVYMFVYIHVHIS